MATRIKGRFATTLGCIAVVIWSSSAVILYHIKSIPLFELVGLLFVGCSVPSLVSISLKKNWKKIEWKWSKWAIGVSSILLFQILFVLALRYLEPATAELILSLWPSLGALLISLRPGEKFTWKYLVPIGVGLSAVWMLLGSKITVGNARWYWLLPLFAALSWTGYLLFSRHHKDDPPEMIGLYFGAGGLICLMIRGFSLSVSGTSLLLVAFLGVGVLGFSQVMWDTGVKRGNAILMSIFANIAPALSMGWLCLFGLAKISTTLIFSYLLVVLASFISLRIESRA